MKLFKFSAIILIVGCFCWQIEAKPASILQFSISFDKDEYKTKDPIYVNFELKNKGSKPVYVNKRFYVSSEDSDLKDREVFFQIKGPSGEKLPYKASYYGTGFPKTDYFVLLGPKEGTISERKKNLKAYFDLSVPGIYKVTAVYQNMYGPEIGIDAFGDKIKSKPVTIKVAE